MGQSFRVFRRPTVGSLASGGEQAIRSPRILHRGRQDVASGFLNTGPSHGNIRTADASTGADWFRGKGLRYQCGPGGWCKAGRDPDGAPSSSGPAPRSAARRNAGAPASQMGRPSRVATVAVDGANGPGNKAVTNVAPILGDRRQTLPSSQGVVARSAAERLASSTMVGKTNTPGFGKGFSKAPVMTLPAATPSNRGRVATPESAAKPVSVLPASAPGQAAVPSSSASVVRRATRVGVIERVPGSRGSAGFWLRSLEPGRGSLGAWR